MSYISDIKETPEYRIEVLFEEVKAFQIVRDDLARKLEDSRAEVERMHGLYCLARNGVLRVKSSEEAHALFDELISIEQSTKESSDEKANS